MKITTKFATIYHPIQASIKVIAVAYTFMAFHSFQLTKYALRSFFFILKTLCFMHNFV